MLSIGRSKNLGALVRAISRDGQLHTLMNKQSSLLGPLSTEVYELDASGL